MRRNGLWLTVVALGLLLVSLALAAVLKFLMPGMGSPLRLFFVSVPLLAAGPSLWLAGWIVSVFAKEQH